MLLTTQPAYYLLLTTYYSLLTTHCASLTTHYLLPSNLELTSKVAKEVFDVWVNKWQEAHAQATHPVRPAHSPCLSPGQPSSYPTTHSGE